MTEREPDGLGELINKGWPMISEDMPEQYEARTTVVQGFQRRRATGVKTQLLKVGTVAKRLRVSRQRVHNLLKEKPSRFPKAFQLEDGTWLIPKSDLDKLRIAPTGGRPKKEAKK
jgi:predicted DNA-binding transcriptional regulator AlpA